MNKIIKITLVAIATLAMSFTIGCSNNKDEEKWCVVETTPTDKLKEPIKTCYKIGSKSKFFKFEFQCAAAKEILSLAGVPDVNNSYVKDSKPKDCIVDDD